MGDGFMRHAWLACWRSDPFSRSPLTVRSRSTHRVFSILRVIHERKQMNTSPETAPPDAPQQQRKSYWHGYVYAAFWAYVTYSCLTHLIGKVLLFSSRPTGSPEAAAEFWTQVAIWPIATAAFGWTTFRLVTRKATMTMVYVLVVIHGLNVLMRGIRPIELVFYIALSGVVVTEFKKHLKPK